MGRWRELTEDGRGSLPAEIGDRVDPAGGLRSSAPASHDARGHRTEDARESRVVLDEDDPERIRDVVRPRSSKEMARAYNLIEEMMVAANEAVGGLAMKAKLRPAVSSSRSSRRGEARAAHLGGGEPPNLHRRTGLDAPRRRDVLEPDQRSRPRRGPAQHDAARHGPGRLSHRERGPLRRERHGLRALHQPHSAISRP